LKPRIAKLEKYADRIASVVDASWVVTLSGERGLTATQKQTYDLAVASDAAPDGIMRLV
jgi:hypothetical protein